MEKIIINIEGMGCKKCVAKVEYALKDVPNVIKAKASLENKNVIISYNDSIDKELIINKIENAGYKVIE